MNEGIVITQSSSNTFGVIYSSHIETTFRVHLAHLIIMLWHYEIYRRLILRAMKNTFIFPPIPSTGTSVSRIGLVPVNSAFNKSRMPSGHVHLLTTKKNETLLRKCSIRWSMFSIQRLYKSLRDNCQATKGSRLTSGKERERLWVSGCRRRKENRPFRGIDIDLQH